MSDVLIVGGGFCPSMLAALRATGVTVMVVERVTPIANFGELPPELDVRELVSEVPQHIRPLPIPAALMANLPKRSSWQVPARSLPRPREARTRRGK